jgi:hypothetical protein
MFSENPMYGLSSFSPKNPARNLVELFDFIDGVKDFGAVHCFDVVNGAL